MFKVVLNIIFVGVLTALDMQAMNPDLKNTVANSQSSTLEFEKTIVKQIKDIENDLSDNLKFITTGLTSIISFSDEACNTLLKKGLSMREWYKIFNSIPNTITELEDITIQLLNIAKTGKDLSPNKISALCCQIIFKTFKIADEQMQNIFNQLDSRKSNIFDIFDRNSRFYYSINNNLCTTSNFILHMMRCVSICNMPSYLCKKTVSLEQLITIIRYFMCNRNESLGQNNWFWYFSEELLKEFVCKPQNKESYKKFLSNVDLGDLSFSVTGDSDTLDEADKFAIDLVDKATQEPELVQAYGQLQYSDDEYAWLYHTLYIPTKENTFWKKNSEYCLYCLKFINIQQKW